MTANGRLVVTTWNVLHRIHAVNWKEPPVAAFPDERARAAQIAAVVARWMETGAVAVCLQEVSGDQLEALRAALPASVRPDVDVFHHTYPRLPRLREPSAIDDPPPLTDATEQLVTIVRGSARRVEGQTFPTDPGKGFLAVAIADELLVVNTHVTFGPRRDAQLASVAKVARASPTRATVIAGDFNATADAVRASFGGTLAISDLTGQRPTRVSGGGKAGSTIDHVIVLDADLVSATVLDGGGLSDHDPVTAALALRQPRGAF